MNMVLAQSASAKTAYDLVRELQLLFVALLDGLIPSGTETNFESIPWLRAQGLHGGGNRYVSRNLDYFNRASVNISQVQYEADASKQLGSASALSTIIHPHLPAAPSVHMHISWTEMKSGEGYWRIMADLNPSLPSETDQRTFEEALKQAAGSEFDSGKAQGERYFYIPALERHRGVAHFYLEQYRTGDFTTDRDFARNFGTVMIQAYIEILGKAWKKAASEKGTESDRDRQLDYHSLYFLQVLTLDRGTTSGLLVHDENDTGILGSLPSHVNPPLLASWLEKLPGLQSELLRRILATLPQTERASVDDAVKRKIAQVTRAFYAEYPEAQNLLARGDIIPPTQANHK